MGAQQSSSTLPESDLPSVEERIASHPVLQNYRVEAPLLPGSGRLMKTFRLRHRTEATAVLKTAWLLADTTPDQIQELTRLRQLLKDQTHVAPFLYWWRHDEASRTVRGTTWTPVYLLRPHYYTTISDRLASRPWLQTAEKLYLAQQFLSALQHMHTAGVVHGFVTTENMACTGTGWLVLTDLASYKCVTLPDDDPSEFVYYFQRTAERRCYLAPERFDTSTTTTTTTTPRLTPAMDVFSAGCCLAEIFLNGEATFTLGDLLEYRRRGESAALQQHLAKLERPAVRAACKHMLALKDRLSAGQYLERLAAAEPFPDSFRYLDELMEQITTQTPTPDARLALAARAYSRVVWETIGVRDEEMQTYLNGVLGNEEFSPKEPEVTSESVEAEDLFAETESLLKQLESLQMDDEETGDIQTSRIEDPKNTSTSEPSESQQEERSEVSKTSLLIYLQIITATIRHVQRPASRLVALQLLKRLAKHSTDEARLQRIVPVTISLLHDQDALVRASAIQVLTYTLSIVQSFPPSDAQIFPQYVFKRVAHLITDPSLVARLAFAQNVAVLSETALGFLDITHAVRLYEAVGSGTQSVSASEKEETVFGDDVHRLLDSVSRSSSKQSLSEQTDSSDKKSEAGRTMIYSTYATELAALQDTVSRWVVQLTTDQSNHSSLSKRAVLQDLGRLCAFFGLDGVMTFILPQILAFLNERKDWELRAAMLEQLPSVCCVIGRAATEEFVLPCVEIGLVDGKEQVVSRAMHCLASLVQMGLLSRQAIMGSTAVDGKRANSCLLKKYASLMLHPSEDIRISALNAYAAMCRAIGPVDGQVHVMPLLGPLFRFQPTTRYLTSPEGLENCLDSPWSREKYQREIDSLASSAQRLSQAMGAWTSIGISVSEEATTQSANTNSAEGKPSGESLVTDSQVALFREYLAMLLKHTASSSDTNGAGFSLSSGIEGSVKLAQSIMFPKQNGRGQNGIVPSWYIELRDEVEANNLLVSADSAIRSVSSLGNVFGLSIMGPANGASDGVVDASAGTEGISEGPKDALNTDESKNIESAFAGRWGAETTVDPEIVDTSLLLTKLKAMQVPPLPPQLGGRTAQSATRYPSSRGASSVKNWKPKMNALMATSAPATGHNAPVMRLAVSADQSFFVSASHDGSCRVWEIPQIEDSPGILESSARYTGHYSGVPVRVNDVAMLEGSHSVISGASDGSVHVWRVDVIATSSSKTQSSSQYQKAESSRVVGTSCVRKVDPNEGEIMGVSHFNSSASSVVTFATQKGVVHSWDLRSAQEPFSLKHSPGLGNLTALALGSDRNWLVTGTGKGYLCLWDIRFQQPLKLWRHSRTSSISRLATSYVQSPQQWGSTDAAALARPFVFVASGDNECGMFDVLSGVCHGCFRTIEGDTRNLKKHIDEPPLLETVQMASLPGVCKTKTSSPATWPVSAPSSSSVNCMVGSIGAGDQSYLVTGASDGLIRFWDFAVPSKCFVVSGQSSVQSRPSYERIDFDGNRRLMLCRQSSSLGVRDANSMPRALFRGLKKPEHYHSDSVQDLKIIDNSSLISCSRDCTVKVWR